MIHLVEGKARWDSSAGPVPPRVDPHVKAGLLDLIDHAVEAGWSARRADRAPGGAPVHGLPPAERAAIVELFETWGHIDRSHRKLADRGSRLELVHVSESTMRRLLTEEQMTLPGNPPREPTPRKPWPERLERKTHRISRL